MRTDFDQLDISKKYQEKEYLQVGFEIKQIAESDDYYTISGYGSTFGNVDRGKDVILKGAFKDTLNDFLPSYLWIHQMDTPIGKVVKAYEDSKGLYIEARLPKDDTFVMGRVIPQMKIGSVRAMSIGYYPESWELNDDGIRVISKIVLFEVSPVHLPMNPKATIDAVKSLDIEAVQEIKTKRDFEKCLRDSGAFSQKAAVYLASHFSEPEPSDSGTGDDLKGLLNGLTDLLTVTKKLKDN